MIKYMEFIYYYIFSRFSSLFYKNNMNIKDIKNEYKIYKSYKCHSCFSIIKDGPIYFAIDKEFCTDICRENYINII